MKIAGQISKILWRIRKSEVEEEWDKWKEIISSQKK